MLFGESISFGEGLLITALGMGVTFATLIVLSFLLDLLRVIFYKDPNKNKPVEVKKEIKDDIEEKKIAIDDGANGDEVNEELVAVITAAIASSMNTSTHNIIVKNISRVPDQTPTWGRMGRIEQMDNML